MRAASTKFVPLSKNIQLGLTLRAVNRLKALINELAVKEFAISM